MWSRILKSFSVYFRTEINKKRLIYAELYTFKLSNNSVRHSIPLPCPLLVSMSSGSPLGGKKMHWPVEWMLKKKIHGLFWKSFEKIVTFVIVFYILVIWNRSFKFCPPSTSIETSATHRLLLKAVFVICF